MGKIYRVSYERLLVVCLFIFASLAFFKLLNKDIPYRDSGLFLYIGQQLNAGEVLYRNLWDSKPPIIFFINAFALWLTPGKLTGLWLLEYVTFISSFSLLYRLLRKYFSNIVVLFSLLISSLGYLSLFDGGNYTEEFALPLQILAIYFFLYIVNKKHLYISSFSLGIGLVLTFLLKQHLIGIYFVILIYWLFIILKQRVFRKGIYSVIFILLGSLIGLLPIAYYLITNHALQEFYSVAFAYNFHYSNTPFINHLYSSLNSISTLGMLSGLSYLALPGWILAALRRIRKKAVLPVVLLATIDLPVEIILSGISGKGFSHYYITLIPSTTILACYFLSQSLALINKTLKRQLPTTTYYQLIMAISCIFLYTLTGLFTFYGYYYSSLSKLKSPIDSKMAVYVLQHSKPTEYILVWGYDSYINFVTQRKTPTRYVNQAGLYREGYHTAQMVQLFFTDIVKNQPVLILDDNGLGSWIPPLSCEKTRIYQPKESNNSILPQMQTVLDYLCDHYTYTETIGYWRIYRRN